MSLMPFSSRSSSRSSGGGDAGGEKKLSNRKYTISLSFSGLITSGIITIIAIGWIFAFGVIVGRAYKSKDSADKLRERMEGEGLRTRMTIEKDNKGRPKWFRVQVLVRGTDADASAAKQVLVKMGLKDATQVSKKPVRGR